MKYVFISIGAVILILLIAFTIIYYVSQKNVKDKGGMENPNYRKETTSYTVENNSDNK